MPALARLPRMQSHYIDATQRDIFMGQKMWFGLVSANCQYVLKKMGWLWANLKGTFFMFSGQKKNNFFENLALIKHYLTYPFILRRVKSCSDRKCLNRKTTMLENLKLLSIFPAFGIIIERIFHIGRTPTQFINPSQIMMDYSAQLHSALSRQRQIYISQVLYTRCGCLGILRFWGNFVCRLIACKSVTADDG